MDDETYFDRVVRFLETKGWNTTTTQVTAQIRVVTGTRKSENYYDRMLAMVAIDETTTLTERHIEYLVNAGSEYDVDQLAATARGGLEANAKQLAREHGIEFIETETIDEAFIDEFEIEGTSPFDRAGPQRVGELVAGGSFGLSVQYLIAAALVIGLGFAGMSVAAGFSLGTAVVTETIVPGVLFLVWPTIAFVSSIVLSWYRGGTRATIAGIFAGTLLGYALLVLLVGAAVAAIGGVGTTGLFSPMNRLAAVLATGLVTAVMAIGAGVLHDRLLTAAD